MSTHGVQLRRLEIRAFRGLANPPSLDLRSPVTLIVAANGTGKTTLCEAAEWLLTGQVERLKDGARFDVDVLRSKFTPGEEPSVNAELVVDGQARALIRTPSDARLGPTLQDVRPVAPSELLYELAPAPAAREVHHLTAIPLRQSWLRGTRFLSAEALGALVDTDPETIERRRQIFADMLGIREFLEAENRLSRYAGALQPRVHDLSRRIQETERAVEALRASSAANRSATPAADEIARANVLLGMPPSEPEVSLPSRVEQAAAEIGRRDLRLKRLREHLSFLDRNWARFGELGRAIARDRELEIQLRASEAAAHSSATEAQHDVGQKTLARAQAERALQPLLEFRDQVVPHLQALAEAVRALPSPPLSLVEARGNLSEAGWSAKARGERLERVQALLEQRKEVLEARGRLHELERGLDALKPPLPEVAMVGLSERVMQAEQALASARARFDGLAAPVERLREAAQDYLDHDHSESSCPVCSFDWGTSDALRSAIHAVVAVRPRLLEDAEMVVRQCSVDLEAARGALESAHANALRHQEAVNLVRAAKTPIVAYEESVQRLGLDAGEPGLEEQLRVLERRLLAAEHLARLDVELAGHSHDLASLVPNDMPLDRAVSSVQEEIERQSEARNVVATASIRALEEAYGSLDEANAKVAEASSALEGLRTRVERASAELEAIMTVWRESVGDLDLRREILDETNARAVSEQGQLREAEQAVAAARSALRYELQHDQIRELEGNLTQLRKEEARVSALRQTAQSGATAFRAYYLRQSRTTVETLAKVVNPLFARMHANRVFDRIKFGENDDMLHWLAVAGDAEPLDPQRHFSHGQRQDLALALFLARARDLGGTFFLDEPVSHLDDLNRVGLLDVIRATAIEGCGALSFVITTGSRILARHVIEKFARVSCRPDSDVPLLSVIELVGNPRVGVEVSQLYSSG